MWCAVMRYDMLLFDMYYNNAWVTINNGFGGTNEAIRWSKS